MKYNYHPLRAALAVAVLLIVAACANMGLSPAKTPEQQLAYAYGTVAAIRTSAAQALAAGTISVSDAQKVLTDSDAARAALDAGKLALASGGNPNTVQADLTIATGVITQLQSFLTAKGVK